MSTQSTPQPAEEKTEPKSVLVQLDEIKEKQAAAAQRGHYDTFNRLEKERLELEAALLVERKAQADQFGHPQFDDWSEAFDYCREKDAPVVVIIWFGNRFERWKIFPSGGAWPYPPRSKKPA